MVESGRQPGDKSNYPLVFPDLIMAICDHGRINIPLQVHETINGNIDDLYVSMQCVAKKKKSSCVAFSGNMNFQDWNMRKKLCAIIPGTCWKRIIKLFFHA